MDELVTEKILSRAKGSKWTIGSIVSSPEVQGYRTSRETLKAEQEAVSLFETVTDVPHQLSCLFIIQVRSMVEAVHLMLSEQFLQKEFL